MCVYLKNRLCTKVFVWFLFSRQKTLMLHSSLPTPIPPPQEGWCSGTNLLQYLQVNIYLLEKSEFRMEKISEKQGSSAIDISIAMMAAFFRRCTEQQQSLQIAETSTALSQYISSSVEPWS